MKRRFAAILLALIVLPANGAYAQSFGVELFNNLMPASGGMAGTSIAAPQDLQSAINGNPATLTQYRGTQFGMGGAWVEPTYNVSAAPGMPFVGPFDAKSQAQGVAAPNIGVTQDFSAWEMPVTMGLGLMSGSGAGVDFRQVPASNGTHASLVALDIIAGAGVSLTDRLSLGASLILSNATMAGPFVGNTGSSADYGLRGSVGVNYDVTPDTNLGVFWKSKAAYKFQNLVTLSPPFPTDVYFDVAADRPQCVGLGIANKTLLDGRLLLAMDAVFQEYASTAMFGDLFNNQWALQFGAQYALNERVRLRAGYAWNENPMRDSVGNRLSGLLPPGGVEQVQYVEALFAAIPQDRITAGVTVRDVLPGVDLDLFAGGMFKESQTFGSTTAEVQSYWIGTGITWRFGRGGCSSCEEVACE